MNPVIVTNNQNVAVTRKQRPPATRRISDEENVRQNPEQQRIGIAKRPGKLYIIRLLAIYPDCHRTLALDTFDRLTIPRYIVIIRANNQGCTEYSVWLLQQCGHATLAETPVLVPRGEEDEG